MEGQIHSMPFNLYSWGDKKGFTHEPMMIKLDKKSKKQWMEGVSY